MLILDDSNDLINPQVIEQEIGSDLEPLQDEEVVQFRAQVLNMGVLSSDGANSRERELARMVLRLTESSRPSSAQIASQAAIILDLSTQRDYLIQQAEEERARWESERDGWERASEALIAQRNTKDHYSNRHQELERYCSILQTDNEDLRRREQQLLKRLTSLEDEMVKLKPVLLLDPFPATASESSLSHASAYLASLPYPAASGKEAVRAQRSRRKKLEAKHKDIDPLDQELDHVAASSAPNDSPNSTGLGAQGTSSRNPKDLDGKISQSYIPDQLQDDSNVLPSKSVRSEKHVSRRTEPPGTLLLWPAHIQPPATPPSLLETPSAILDAPSAPGLNERSENAAFDSAIEPPLASSLSKPARPLTSDARMEHLLLAARMIGRKRAAFAAGIMDAELEKEQKERKEKEKEWREKEKEKKQREREREKKEREIVEKSKSERSKEKTSSTATLRSSAGGSRSLKGKSKGKEKALPKSSGIGKSNSLKRTPSRSGRELEGMLDDEVIVGSSKQRRTKQTRPKPRALSASSSAGSTQKTLSGMDSLLSAARSMMDHGSNQFTTRDKANKGGIDIDSTAGSRRPASELGGYEDTDMLPPAKRQKSLVVSSNRPMRTPSALDVLADQAAAAVSTSAASSDMDSTILEGKIVKNDLEDSEDAEGEYEDDPADSNSVTRLNSPTTNTDGPRRNSRRSASSRSVINTRVISSAKSPTKGLS